MTQQQKAWMYDMEPTVRVVDSQEVPGRALLEVRSTRYPIINGTLAGIGETLEEAVANAISLNGYRT